MAIPTAWLVGSYYVPAFAATIDGTPVQITTVDQGFYLYHPTDDLSLIYQLEHALLGAGVTGAAVRVLESRHVRITAVGAFDLNWGSTLSRDLYGFVGNLSGANSYTATNISPLLWSPGKPETPTESPLGVAGRRVYDTKLSVAPDGTTVADSHYTQRVQTFNWSHVPMDRFQTSSEVGGEYVVFYDYVLHRGHKFDLWRGIAEDVEGAFPVVWTSYLGPYSLRQTRGLLGADFQRSPGFERVDRRAQVSLDCTVVPEWEVISP